MCWISPNNVVCSDSIFSLSLTRLLIQKINQIFGYRSGLGFSLLTFDWNQIAFIGSPWVTVSVRLFPVLMLCARLATPCKVHSRRLVYNCLNWCLGWAEANVIIGFLFFYCMFVICNMHAKAHSIPQGLLTPIFYVRTSVPLIPQAPISFIPSIRMFGTASTCRMLMKLFSKSTTWPTCITKCFFY